MSNGMTRRGMLGLTGLGIAGAVLAACSKPQWIAGGQPSSGPSGGGSPAPSPTPSDGLIRGSGKPVHVRLLQGDGTTWGVGMPIIAYINTDISDAHMFAKATKVTVNGQPAEGAWFFQNSAIYPDYPVEAHYRTEQYWPANADIRLDLPIQGLTAGQGLVFDNSLTLDMKIGPRNISEIDGQTLKMNVTSDGQPKFTFPVSLGKASTPTFNGIKVVVTKAAVQRMVSTEPGNTYDIQVPWSVRLTNSGEFIHSADFNGQNIGQRSTSHGCTNISSANAKLFFDFAQIGDVTVFTNTGGSTMPSWDGYGDWNLAWATWQQGGLYKIT
jgi:lipoprotein-anchoring transpeptidase ErfK/SrfK